MTNQNPSTKDNVKNTKPPVSANVLVGGGAGFVGSHLCEALLQKNCRVFCVDNWSTGKRQNVKNFIENPNLTFIEHNLNEPLEEQLPRLDYVFHLAGLDAYLSDSEINLKNLLVNSRGTEHLLQLAKESSAQFLLASSMYLYAGVLSDQTLSGYFGDSKELSGTFSLQEAKRFAEALTAMYVQEKKLAARIVRVGDVYGPRMSLNSTNQISQLVKSTLNNQSFKIPNQGMQRLHPTYVGDVVDGLVKAMFSQHASGRVISLVNPESTTLINIAYILRQISNQDLQIEFVKTDNLQPNLELNQAVFKSQKRLVWSPKMSLKDGLINTLEWWGNASSLSLTKKTKETKGKKDVSRKTQISTATAKKPPEPTTRQPSTPHKNYPNHSPIDQPAEVGQVKDPLDRALDENLFKDKNLTQTPFEPDTSYKKNNQEKKLGFLKNLFKGFKNFNPPKLKVSKKILVLVVFLLGFISLFSFPIAAFGYFSRKGFENLKTSIVLNPENTNEGQASLQALTGFNRAESYLDFSSSILRIFGLGSQIRQVEEIITAGQEAAQAASFLNQSQELFNTTLEKSIKSQPADFKSLTSSVSQNLSQAKTKLDSLQARIDAYPSWSRIKIMDIGEKVTNLKQTLPRTRLDVEKAISLSHYLDELLAVDGRKTYLLVFQNNYELRPTGGFIGSIGILTLEKGRVLDLSVYDINQVESQIQGEISAPDEIEKHLGEGNWHFRDANWDPDFPATAKQLEWFLSKSLHRQVDGVVAINYRALSKVLKASKPVYLNQIQETVSAPSLEEKALNYARINSLPSDNGQQEFFKMVVEAWFSQVSQNSQTDWSKLANGLITGLENKDILVYLHNPQIDKVMSRFGWTGSVREIVPSRNSVNNYVYVNEANLGVNQANYYLNRQMSHLTQIDTQGQIKQKLTINYQNQSPSASWPAGDYKSLVRVYLPATTRVENIKIANQDEVEFEQSTWKDKKKISFFLEVPTSESRQVVVNYQSTRQLPIQAALSSYLLYWQKQPGSKDTPIRLKLEYAQNLEPIKASPKGEALPQAIEFFKNLDTDSLFKVDFQS